MKIYANIGILLVFGFIFLLQIFPTSGLRVKLYARANRECEGDYEEIHTSKECYTNFGFPIVNSIESYGDCIQVYRLENCGFNDSFKLDNNTELKGAPCSQWDLANCDTGERSSSWKVSGFRSVSSCRNSDPSRAKPGQLTPTLSQEEKRRVRLETLGRQRERAAQLMAELRQRKEAAQLMAELRQRKEAAQLMAELRQQHIPTPRQHLKPNLRPRLSSTSTPRPRDRHQPSHASPFKHRSSSERIDRRGHRG
jgi:hypothetical protein